jgi:hypothetical protein
MSELAFAEHLRRLGERLAELELRVDLLAKALAGVTSGDLDRDAPRTRWAEPQPWHNDPSEGAA